MGSPYFSGEQTLEVDVSAAAGTAASLLYVLEALPPVTGESGSAVNPAGDGNIPKRRPVPAEGP